MTHKYPTLTLAIQLCLYWSNVVSECNKIRSEKTAFGSTNIFSEKNLGPKEGRVQKFWEPKVLVLYIVTTPTTTQHNLNTAVGMDMDTKMTLHTTHHRNSTSAFWSP